MSVYLYKSTHVLTLTVVTQVGMISRTSARLVLVAFLMRYGSYTQRPMSLNTRQNFLYKGYRLLAFRMSAGQLPTKKVGGLLITHGEQKQWGHGTGPPTKG